MKIERTLVLMKPDAVQRCFVGKILTRFEDAGLKTVGMKMKWVDKKFAEEHYRDIKERYDKRILDNLTNYLREGPVIAIVLEGVSAIKIVRKLVGETPYPDECSPGTIRGDFAHISKNYANKHEKKVGNLIHASADEKDAKFEIPLWFTKEEMHTYSTVHEVHII